MLYDKKASENPHKGSYRGWRWIERRYLYDSIKIIQRRFQNQVPQTTSQSWQGKLPISISHSG